MIKLYYLRNINLNIIMSLDDKFIPFRTTIYEMVNDFFRKIAGFFGYPQNLGMSTQYNISDELYAKQEFRASLPKYQTRFPPFQEPQSWFEVLVGPTPKTDTVVKYIYESQDEGFYNFYIENYSNMYFLPDWLSEFLQVQWNQCLDISLLETIREVLFIGLVVYYQIVILRISLSWLIYINPYTVPWCFVVSAVDWTDEVLTGVTPSIFGVNMTGTIFLGFLGILGDSLNHIVFTMPFLPSEGEPGKLLIDEQMKDVLLFHYLPKLWYKYPIPNEIREFWFSERPEILQYMQRSYHDLNIQLLPNQVLESFNAPSQLAHQISDSVYF